MTRTILVALREELLAERDTHHIATPQWLALHMQARGVLLALGAINDAEMSDVRAMFSQTR